MKSFDHTSQRILACGIALSAVLLSASLFVFSIQPLVAESPIPHGIDSKVVPILSGVDYAAVVATQDAAYAFTFDEEGNVIRCYRADSGGFQQIR